MSYVRVRELCTSPRCQYWKRGRSPDLLCSLHTKSAAPLRNFLRHRFVQLQSLTSCVQERQQTKRSSLSRTTDDADPGHWEYSPEWWGTHDGGWGRDSGKILFSQQSHCGNGEITVTAHPASSTPTSSELEQEWRVLRFNDTRQSVSRVLLSPKSLVPQADAACLAFEYLKTMASAAAAVIGVSGKLEAALQPTAHNTAKSRHTARQLQMHASPMGHSNVTQGRSTADGGEASRVLCIGLGGGSLPNFLSHHFPGMLVDAAELDPLVVTVASDHMGFPRHRPNMQLHQGDAADYVLQLAAEVRQGHIAPLDMVCVDAFDGNDDVPASLWSSDSVVLDALSQALHPEHGSLVMNLHGGGLPTAAQFAALLALLTSCLPFAPQITHSGYHQSTEKGRAVQQITQNLREKLLGHGGGCAFTLSVLRQSNIVVVVTRGMDAEAVQHHGTGLQAAADQTGQAAGYLFNCGSRACRGLTLI